MAHNLEELKITDPSLRGKLILQDRTEVLSTLSPSTVFGATAHDFFTQHPVNRARAYYLHSVLHDWGDEDCEGILEKLKPAPRKRCSRIILNEIVVSENKASLAATSMEVLVAMRERTENRGENCYRSGGLAVSRFRLILLWRKFSLRRN